MSSSTCYRQNRAFSPHNRAGVPRRLQLVSGSGGVFGLLLAAGPVLGQETHPGGEEAHAPGPSRDVTTLQENTRRAWQALF